DFEGVFLDGLAASGVRGIRLALEAEFNVEFCDTSTLATETISKNLDFINRMIWLFSGVSGMIIGAGYVVQSILLVALVYIILRNSEQLLNYFDQETKRPEDGSVENVSN
ncbi:MAG: hypothetical protein QF380_01815, partial [Candidatus Marinimicrobia bacterium]|nr:hypothetical protein [Candidatus Neomarinimicrobiota bacterium]